MSDHEALKNLQRVQLQQLAKREGIPANLSSAVIIARVLKIRAGQNPAAGPASGVGVMSPRLCGSSNEHRTAAPSRGTYSPDNDENVAPDPSDTAGPANIPAVTETPDPIARPFSTSPIAFKEDLAASPAASVQTFGTPESLASSPGTPTAPADPELVRETVAMMAAIDEMDHAYEARLVQMRVTIEKLRTRATELENRLLSERSRRERMENYLIYWQNEPPRWSYEAVWSGQLRVNDLYEGEEIDSDYGQEDQLDYTSTRPKPQSPIQLLAPSSPSTPPPPPPPPESTTHKLKRSLSQEGSDELAPVEADDETRYHPRPRVEEVDPETGKLVPASSPTRKFIDQAHVEFVVAHAAMTSRGPSAASSSRFSGKGKAKMNDAQVEEPGRSLAQPPTSRARTVLGLLPPLTEEEIEQDQVAALVQSQSVEHVDTPHPFIPGPTPALSPRGQPVARSTKVRS